MIPENLEHSHFIRAAAEIDRAGVPVTRASYRYDVYLKGKPYPPKYLIAVASRFAHGQESYFKDYNAVEAKNYFISRGFKVREKAVRTPIHNPRSVPAQGLIRFTWQDGAARNSIDEFPLEFFANTHPKKGLIHRVSNSKDGESKAKCDVTIRGLVAELDYQPYRVFNQQHGMLLGVTRLTFSDTDRTSISQVEWKSISGIIFRKCSFGKPTYEAPLAPAYVPSNTLAVRKARLIRERPGQSIFRKNLRAIYGNKCCMTNCVVAEALEGAHIDRYRNKFSHNAKNGLLLRRDIHALFDQHLIGINPKTGQIHVADEARLFPEYDALHLKPVLAPKNLANRPDLGALSRHWARFTRK